MKYDIPTMTAEAVSLLKSLISIPSISREETQAADFLQNYIDFTATFSAYLSSPGRINSNAFSSNSNFEYTRTNSPVVSLICIVEISGDSIFFSNNFAWDSLHACPVHH